MADEIVMEPQGSKKIAESEVKKDDTVYEPVEEPDEVQFPINVLYLQDGKAEIREAKSEAEVDPEGAFNCCAWFSLPCCNRTANMRVCTSHCGHYRYDYGCTLRNQCDNCPHTAVIRCC